MDPAADRAPLPRQYPALRAWLHWPAHLPLQAVAPAAAAPVAPVAPLARVRPPVRQAKAASSPQALDPALARSAKAALFFASGNDEQTFDIALDEALLGNVRCRISLGPAGVDATFVVDDVNERRLLDGASARLRQALEAKGLKVRQVRVVQVGDPSAPDLLT